VQNIKIFHEASAITGCMDTDLMTTKITLFLPPNYLQILPNKTDTLDNLIHLPFLPYGRSPEHSPQMTMSKTLALMPNPATIYVLMSISTNRAGSPRDVHQVDGPL
jgi:hypothetical protein